MLGDFSKGTNDRIYRDGAEYVTMQLLIQTIPSLRKQGVTVTPSVIQKFRDDWSRDGKPMDFAHMKARPSDLERLLRSTGATSFGNLDKYPTLLDGIRAGWKTYSTEYKERAASGVYLHTIADPDIRRFLASSGGAPLANAVFAHRGQSLRELNAGDAVTLYDKANQKSIFNGYIKQEGFATQPVNQPESQAAPAAPNGFASQPVGPAASETAAAGSASPADDIESEVDENEPLLGWEGGVLDGREYRGLSHVMGAYFTKADAEAISKNIDPKHLFNADYAENSVALLRHMRSNGYDFSVRGSDKRNQIDVRMAAGENVNVRVFDEEKNGAYIGRIYDTYNSYYYTIRGGARAQKDATFNADEVIAPLDYVLGHRTGIVRKSGSRASARVLIEGTKDRSKWLQVRPITGNRYRALVFGGEDDAKTYITDAITAAQKVAADGFKADELQKVIDAKHEKVLDDDAIKAQLDALYSSDDVIREAQEKAVREARHSAEGGREDTDAALAELTGDYENGFNPAFVVDHMPQSDRGNERDAMMSAIKTANYDLNKIKGNDFAVNAMKERLITFDPKTAKSIDQVTHPMLKKALETVRDTLKAGNVAGVDGKENDPDVKIDDNGIIRWEGGRRLIKSRDAKAYQNVSGEIGQVMVPDEHGVIQTKFQGESNYGLVPGYTGYFSFDGDYDDRMKRFRVKGFDQHLTEQLRAMTVHQMTRPFDDALGNIPTTLDASGLNGLYHGDVYGKRIDSDFLETNQLSDETKSAILKTLAHRVRFDNQYSDYATTSAETQANRDYGSNDDEAAFSYWKAAGEKNMRVLDADLENYADLTMTGTGKTQGLIWFLTDGAIVQPDGSVTPSEGLLREDGTREPDKTALQKLPVFDKKRFNAWDRNQMAANQLMTALRVDQNVGAALMAFGGWTFDDSYAVSQEFAERNQVFGTKPNENSMQVLDDVIRYTRDDPSFDLNQVRDGVGMSWTKAVVDEGVRLQEATLLEDKDARAEARDTYQAFLEEHGRFRPLQRGDKLSDFGGNKGTIGIVIDRHMNPEKAEQLKLGKEVRFFKANPELDVVSAPYSMLSRHNAGVVKELMDGETKDLVDPDTGEVFPSAMGHLNIIVTDMKVDNKTHAYTRDDVLDGKGRKASGQLAWALESKGATGILNEIYGRNDSAWSTFREYLIATGLDMGPDGTIKNGYTPHAGEERHHFAFDSDVDAPAFLDKIKDQGGFLDLPFEVNFKNGMRTSELPVLSASLRQNVELVDGSMRRSDFTNYYANIYSAIGEYHGAEKDEDKAAAQKKVQEQFDKIQATIIDRQFDGGHNGKHSFIRDKIMGKRMQHSATGVAVVDPRLEIGQAGMNQDMLDALNAKEGDTVMAFRDPVWRDGAIRAMTVKLDESVHGIAVNPISDKSHDMDFDGDTMGIMKFDTKAANADLVNKFSHWANMIDKGSGKDELYFQTGMDLASAEAKAEKLGDDSPKKLYEKAQKNAKSSDPRVLKQAEKALSEYSHKLFREHGFGSDFVSLKDDEAAFASFKKMVDNGAKGSPKKLEAYKEYHNGLKTDKDAREIQYATGVKSDDTGLAGAFSQKLVSVMRNQNITAALEAMYPLTHGTLQIKHDADHARTVNDILSDDMNKTFRGKNMHNAKRALTPHGFQEQLANILEKKMKVDVNEDYLKAVTETLTHDGQLVSLKDAMKIKGSPMDRVAYGGGYNELQKLADKGENLLEGEQNKLFAPFSMRNASETAILAKKDTQVKREPEPVAAASMASAPVAEPEADEPCL